MPRNWATCIVISLGKRVEQFQCAYSPGSNAKTRIALGQGV